VETLSVYIPMDRRHALAKGESLPDRSGAALFADVSDFTPLTEALVQELGPRRGAEELTRQLNRVYDPLIGQVHRYGGSVIGFSGDAITCWLEGTKETGGLRATACALAMQEEMRQFAEVKTPAGTTVSLAIKVAVVAGPVRRFLVGDPQNQLIDALAGRTLDDMAAAGKQAGREEVVVAAEIVAQSGGRMTVAEWRQDETGGRFAVVTGLAEPVAGAPWPDLAVDKLTETQARAWLLPPVYERLQSGQGEFLAELRPAVALFLKFSGLDYDRDEAAGEKLDAYIRWVQHTLARYEGSLLQLTIGDKGSFLYAAFGAPLAHDDDPARAIAAALALQALPPALDFISPPQIGLGRGQMRTGAYGSHTRRTYGLHLQAHHHSGSGLPDVALCPASPASSHRGRVVRSYLW